MSTKLEHLRIRMIAAENLPIALLAQDPDRPDRLARAMPTFISPRPGFSRHLGTRGGASQMANVVERAHHFQGWVKGKAFS